MWEWRYVTSKVSKCYRKSFGRQDVSTELELWFVFMLLITCLAVLQMLLDFLLKAGLHLIIAFLYPFCNLD